jgi:protein-S-isoprenylcysteine O-methyltransferase Ste14
MRYLFILSVIVAAFALRTARREYRTHGKLTWPGLFLVCLMLLLPNVLIDYATSYSWPDTALEYAGVLLAAGGLALCFAGIAAFRSLPKVLCLDPGSLADSGPYRWGRNPQYVGWVLFLAGFCLTDWSPWCYAALAVVAVSLHLLVLIEEEHLRRVFGEAYVEFCNRTPRYFGWADR